MVLVCMGSLVFQKKYMGRSILRGSTQQVMLVFLGCRYANCMATHQVTGVARTYSPWNGSLI